MYEMSIAEVTQELKKVHPARDTDSERMAKDTAIKLIEEFVSCKDQLKSVQAKFAEANDNFIKSEACRQKWIPICDDAHVPEDGQEVLATVRSFAGGYNVREIRYYSELEYWNTFVIAWMPKPLPYNEDQSQKRKEALDLAIKIREQQRFEDKTNGDVIKAMFPDVEVKEKNNGYEVYFGVGTAIQFFNHQWWNSPYKESDKND